MLYIVRQAHPSGGFLGCFGRPGASHGEADLVCPLCAHETGDATRKTARLSASRYIQCESCGRFSAVFTEDGTALVPGVVLYALLTGLENLPATRHALVLDGLVGESLQPRDEGAWNDLKAALQGDGNLISITQVDETKETGHRATSRRVPVVRLGMSDAPARLAGLSRRATADDNEPTGVPRELAVLMHKV